MKNKIGLIGAAIVGCAALTATMIIAGCSSMSSQQQQVANGIVTLGVTDGAAAATALVLKKNPEYLPDFQLGASVLQTLASGTNAVNASDIAGTLESAGETNAVVDAVVIQAAQSAADILSSQTNAVIQQQEVDQVLSAAATGIRQGVALEQALQSPPVPTPAN
ncbi:MAG TPA: hypothetical protein VGY56_10610 [Verrucomicrobiae bacterium]|nr:hypothetical protein [Verrucomicrobiae bacterium]